MTRLYWLLAVPVAETVGLLGLTIYILDRRGVTDNTQSWAAM